MRLAPDAAENEDDDDGGPNQREKVIVRSNGTVTYVGKDIANQFWKFGLLGKDFHYRPFATRRTGETLWATTSTGSDGDVPAFGLAPAGLQRHRLAPVLPAEAPQAGAGDDRHRTQAEQSIALLVRDGGAVARDGARARVRGRWRRQAVRRGLRPQGPRREGRRSARPADRDREPKSPRAIPAHRRRTAATATAEAIAAVRYFMVKFDTDQDPRLRHRRGPELRR